MAKTTFVPPRWGDRFVNANGVPTRRSQAFIDEISRILSSEILNLSELTDRVDELEPQYVVVDNADSPYEASNNDYILADMSAGDVTIVLPNEGRLSVSRSGSSNILTIEGTVEGETDPAIIADGDSPALAYIGTEWRYV